MRTHDWLRAPGALLLRAFLAGAILAAAILPAPARADTKGFAFGVQLHSNQLGSVEAAAGDVPESVFIEENGGGLGLWAGWGINESFSLRLALDLVGHETSDDDIRVAYGSLAVEGLYLFRQPDALRPFLLGGVGTFGLASRDDAYDYATTGPGLLAGGGIYYFLGSTFALEFSGRGEFVNWNEKQARRIDGDGSTTVTAPVEREGVAGKLTLGASLWF